jgi:hypothetical protein
VKRNSHLPAAGLATLLGLLLFLTGTINLESVPPLWWDEGWILTVARNWVEHGHYGRLLAGKPASASMTTGFPVVAPVALSFRLFGVGIWQGRIVGVLFTLGALALIYHLASQLYDRLVALATLVVLLLMSGQPDLHPVIIGRQALGEIPAIFYLLGGYACFLWALHKSIWSMAPAIAFWSIALTAKLQVLPFWTVSLLIPLLMAILRRSWKLMGHLIIGLVGSLIMSQLLLWLLRSLVSVHTLPFSLVSMLYNVSVLVPAVPGPRLVALIATLEFGLATLLGLYYAASKLMKKGNQIALTTPEGVSRLALLTLAGSWLGWYLFLSIGWGRYLFPATFIGSIFAAAFLRRVTDGFKLLPTIRRAGYALRHLHFSRENAEALFITVLITWTSSFTVSQLYRSYFVRGDRSVLLVADFINNQTGRNALIETYDSELFFLLNRRYHYPPDQIHVDLNRRTFLGQDVPINYDPLTADPDYLVVGPQSKQWQLYDPVLATGAFRLLHSYSRYDLYERVR